MSVPALRIRDLTKSFNGLTALDSVSFEVADGETFGLLGPNGAGKSTLINILSGVLPYDSGHIEYYGVEHREPTVEFKLTMGVIPQEINLYEKLSARENLEFYGRLYGLDESILKSEINEKLEMVGLTDRQNDRIGTYSGGMKHRINIAASILHSPKFIMMDEPTVGIDPQSRNLIFEVIEKLNEEGSTIIYTSHYMEEVERLCRNIAILDHGKVVAVGTRAELIALTEGRDTIEIELLNETEEPDSVLKTFEDMDPSFGEGSLQLRTVEGSRKVSEIVGRLANINHPVKSITVREPNLENVFLHLTGKELRD